MKNYPIIRIVTLLLIVLLTARCSEEKIDFIGSGNIKGEVLSEPDLTPIPNAEVTTNPPSHIVMTDSAGQFILEDVEIGEYNVVAKKRDYFTSSVSINVAMNATTHVMVKMNERYTDQDLPRFTPDFYPGPNEKDVSVNVTFSWKVTQDSDSISYTLRLFEAGKPEEVVVENITDTFALVTGLKYSTSYLWQLTAKNPAGERNTETRSFTTRKFPDDYILYAKRADGVSQLFIKDMEHEESIQLTHGSHHNWQPVSNAQQNRVAFLSTRDITPQLYTMNPDGTNVRKITNIATGGYYNKGVGFSWLPNGEQLVFSSYNRLFVVNHDGSGLRQLTSIDAGRHFREVDWSPTNDRIAALTLGEDRYDAEILVMNTNGSDQQVLVGDKKGALGGPAFSLDGKELVYTYDASDTQSDVGRQLNARIFKYSFQTGETVDLSTQKPQGTNDLYPRFSPDGAKIVFINSRNTPGSRQNLYIMRTDSIQYDHRKLLVEDVESANWAKKIMDSLPGD